MFLKVLPILGLSGFLCYARNELEKVPPFEVTDRELSNLVNTLRNQDENKAGSRQIELDYQGHTTTQGIQDNAKHK